MRIDFQGSPFPLEVTMTPDRGTQLFRRFHNGDVSARAELIEMHLSLAYGLARRYANGLEPIDDLRQVAALGLVKAVDRFDPGRGQLFSTFAVPTILGELKRHFRDHGWSLHVERDTKELALKVRRACATLEDEGREVTVPLLAHYLDVSAERVSNALEACASQYTRSYDTPAAGGDEPSGTIERWLTTSDAGYSEVEDRDLFESMSRGLDERARLALFLYHIEEMSQLRVGEQIGISQMQVSRLLRGAHAHIRTELVRAEG